MHALVVVQNVDLHGAIQSFEHTTHSAIDYLHRITIVPQESSPKAMQYILGIPSWRCWRWW